MATYLGSFPRGSQPVALFSGLRVSPRGYGGFGYLDPSVELEPCPPGTFADSVTGVCGVPDPIPDDGGTDVAGWIAAIAKAIKDVTPTIDALGRIINPQTGQVVGQLPPGWTQQQFLAQLQAQQSKLPAWVLPVGIGVGVLVVGGVLFAVLRR